MKSNVKFLEIETFGAKGTKKAVFLDLETYDKIGVLVSGDEATALSPATGKNGELTVSLEKKGFDYSVKYRSFKAA